MHRAAPGSWIGTGAAWGGERLRLGDLSNTNTPWLQDSLMCGLREWGDSRTRLQGDGGQDTAPGGGGDSRTRLQGDGGTGHGSREWGHCPQGTGVAQRLCHSPARLFLLRAPARKCSLQGNQQTMGRIIINQPPWHGAGSAPSQAHFINSLYLYPDLVQYQHLLSPG